MGFNCGPAIGKVNFLCSIGARPVTEDDALIALQRQNEAVVCVVKHPKVDKVTLVTTRQQFKELSHYDGFVKTFLVMNKEIARTLNNY